MKLTDEKLDTLCILGNSSMRFNWTHYEKSGITFSRDVKDEKSKDIFKIYNKEKEIETAKNKKFLSKLKHPDKIQTSNTSN
jgi:hypothetical protein